MIALEPMQLRGSLPPLIAPFRDGELDLGTYRRLVEWQIGSGSHGVTVNGTTGEPSLLTMAERKRLAEVAIDAAAGRFQVLVSTGNQSLAETLDLTGHAEAIGADAVLVVTPYYVRPQQRGLVEYFSQVCSATALPVVAYHIPGRAAISLEVDTIVAIAERNPNFVGMKHAVHDLALVSDVLAALGPDFRILVGLEELSFPMLAVGASGSVNAIANIVPDRIVALHEAIDAGDLVRARQSHFDLYELNKSIFFETNPVPLKYMMRRLGLLERNEHRLPMMAASAATEARCDDVLRRAGLLVEGE